MPLHFNETFAEHTEREDKIPMYLVEITTDDTTGHIERFCTYKPLGIEALPYISKISGGSFSINAIEGTSSSAQLTIDLNDSSYITQMVMASQGNLQN